MCKGEITCFSLPFFNTRVIIIFGECSVANEALQVSRVLHGGMKIWTIENVCKEHALSK